MLPSQLLFWWFLCNSIDMSPVNHFSNICIYMILNFLFYISWLQSGSLLTRIEGIGKFCKYSLSIWVTASMCTFTWKKLVDITAKKRTWTWSQSELWSKLGFKCERICQFSHQLSKTRQFRCCKIHLDHHWNCISTYNYDIEVIGYVFLLLCWQINMVCLRLTALTREVHWVCN
jgi:hypothetical protein